MRIHNAVIANKDKTAGISIHLVNENYDEGRILFQEKLMVDEWDTPLTLASKIAVLEQEHFPKVIEEYIKMHSQTEKN
jgi:phosphoribosylglycinamide formyltransferase-1